MAAESRRIRRHGLVDGLVVRYVGWLTQDLPKQFVGAQSGIEVSGQRTGATTTIQMEEPGFEDDTLFITDISITRSSRSPHAVAALSIDRTRADASSMTHPVSDIHEQFVLGADNNQLSVLAAVISVHRAVTNIREHEPSLY